MKQNFYDVKLKKNVKTEVTGKNKVKNGTGTTYMLKAVTDDGRSLTRFTSKKVYDELNV
jgi:hypothetical protein